MDRTMTDASEPRMQSRVSGQGGETAPLVLLPGGLTGWASWEPFLDTFSPSRTVVRLQLLSVQYGWEDRPLPAGYSVKTESRALSLALDDLGLDEPVDVLGWSYGALISLDFALDHPERIRTLALIEPPAFWLLHALDDPDAEARQIEALSRTLQGDITEEQLARFLCQVGLCPPGKSARELPQWQSWVRHRRSLRNGPAVVGHSDDPGRLATLRRPVLLVKGTGSAGFHHRIVDLLQERLPDAGVAEMPGGHAPHIVSRDRFLSELSRFQGNAPPAPA